MCNISRILICLIMCSILWLLMFCNPRKGSKNTLQRSLSLHEKISINPEIKKALAHYNKPKDSLKRMAMRFLINNMDYKEGLSSAIVKKYTQVYDYILNNGKTGGVENKNIEVPPQLYDQVGQFKDLYYTDLKKITASLLIENVEYAFKAWQLPWAKNVSFPTFCQYILPYRTLDEPLTHWRKQLYENQLNLIDALKDQQIEDPVKVCKVLNDTLLNHYVFYADINAPYLPIEDLYKRPAGNCKQRYLLYASMARAIGLPVTIDFITQYPRYPGSHSWTVLVDNGNGGILAFNGGDEWEEYPFKSIKIYRNTYKNYKRISGYYVPYLFTRHNCIDVTKEYPGKIIDYKIELDTGINEQDVYLYVFGIGPELKAMARGRIRNNMAIFKDVLYREEALVIPVIYKNGQRQIIKNPVLMTTVHQPNIFDPALTNTRAITLQRKYPPLSEFFDFSDHIVGAKIQGAKSRNFQDTTTLFKFKDPPQFYQTIAIEDSNHYRFYRYYIPEKDKHIHLAELNFYARNEKSGSCSAIDKQRYFVSGPSLNLDAACDNNIRTNLNTENHQWIGIDMGANSKKILFKAGILPRNNWNVIERSHQYELFYFDKGWQSLATKKANGFDITYENVPHNAVMLLRDLTEGIQERIFTYRDNRQLFW